MAGGLIGIFAGGLGLAPGPHPMVIIGPLLIAGIVSGATGFFLLRKRLRENDQVRRALSESRTFTWQLVTARWQGAIKNFLGEERALVLNEGASHALRCHRALRSDHWKSAAEGSEHAAVRQRVGSAMDVAMARLMNAIGRGASGSDPEVQSLLADMQVAADEAVKTATRLEGKAHLAGDSSGLRQALSEMRMLNEAQDEVEDFQRQL